MNLIRGTDEIDVKIFWDIKRSLMYFSLLYNCSVTHDRSYLCTSEGEDVS